jgi:hypothetical protein
VKAVRVEAALRVVAVGGCVRLAEAAVKAVSVLAALSVVSSSLTAMTTCAQSSDPEVVQPREREPVVGVVS